MSLLKVPYNTHFLTFFSSQTPVEQSGMISYPKIAKVCDITKG